MIVRLLLPAALLAVSAPAFAQAAPDVLLLRIGCDGANAGAIVSINGEVKGDCPFDIRENAGTIDVVAVKAIDDTHEQRFERRYVLSGGMSKRIDIELSPIQLTPEAQKIEDARLAVEKAARAEAERKAALAARTDTLLREARNAEGPAIEDKLRLIEEIDPHSGATARARMQLAALGSDAAALQAAIGEPWRSERLTVGDLYWMPQLDRWLRDPAFAAFLLETVGAERMAEIATGATILGRHHVLSRMLAGRARISVGRPVPPGMPFARYMQFELAKVQPESWDVYPDNCTSWLWPGRELVRTPGMPEGNYFTYFSWYERTATAVGSDVLLSSSRGASFNARLNLPNRLEARIVASLLTSIHEQCILLPKVKRRA